MRREAISNNLAARFFHSAAAAAVPVAAAVLLLLSMISKARLDKKKYQTDGVNEWGETTALRIRMYEKLLVYL